MKSNVQTTKRTRRQSMGPATVRSASTNVSKIPKSTSESNIKKNNSGRRTPKKNPPEVSKSKSATQTSAAIKSKPPTVNKVSSPQKSTTAKNAAPLISPKVFYKNTRQRPIRRKSLLELETIEMNPYVPKSPDKAKVSYFFLFEILN